ncbi:MAG: hypothetical protein WAK01_18545 [Methylocystis sp.]
MTRKNLMVLLAGTALGVGALAYSGPADAYGSCGGWQRGAVVASDYVAPGYTPVVVAAASGNYCATSVRTCLLQEPGVLGTGCSCHIPGGIARGLVE